MQWVAIDEVYELHERMLKIGGGIEGIRDFTLLHSAVERPKATFSGKALYPDLIHMAAALLQSIVKNHPFYDANKRTGYFTTLLFLERNGSSIQATSDEIYDFVVGIANNNPPLEDIVAWLKKHAKKVR